MFNIVSKQKFDNLPNGWFVTRINKLSKIVTGNTPSMKEVNNYSNEGVLWIKPDNLHGLDITLNTDLKLTRIGVSKSRPVPPFTPLICCIGSVGKVGFTNQVAAFNQQINGVVFNKSMIDSKYGLYSLLSAEDYHKYLAVGNVVKILNKSNHGLVEIAYPPIEQQKAIASFLDEKTSKVDELIEIQESAIERLEVFKEAIINDYISDFVFHKSDFDNDIYYFNCVRIDSICDIVRGNSSFTKNDLRSDGDIIALQYGKTYKIDIVDDSFNHYVKMNFHKESQVCSKGDTIIISTSETMEDLGHTCFYNRDDDGLLGGEQMMLKPKGRSIENKFLYYASTIFTKKLRKHATGLKVYRFNTNHLKNIFFDLPSIERQRDIVHELDVKIPKIQELIAVNKEKIEKLNEYKKSLIYEAVTGKIEVM